MFSRFLRTPQWLQRQQRMGPSEPVATATRSSSEASSNKMPGNAALAVT